MNLEKIVTNIYQKVKNEENLGQTATYIPELAKVNPNNFGVSISSLKETNFGLGNYNDKFSIQSIAKVISLTLAYKLLGEAIWERVGVEPSGNKFNSLVQLESDLGIPRNPFINAGAIVISDMLISNLKNPKQDFLAFVRDITNNSGINYSEKVIESEKSVGYRNVALGNLIKSFDNLKNDPTEVLDFYFTFCSLSLSCKELSDLFLFLANNGRKVSDNTPLITPSQAKRINALMQTCGFYDESGEFAFKVGLPGKSGVGGGIVAIHPNEYCIAVWSPKLNKNGNSFRGMKFLEDFTTATAASIF